MPLRRLRNLYRTLGFRVGAWYSVIFITSTTLLFILAYLFLGAILRSHDYEEIQLELREVQALYDIGGVVALNRYLEQLNSQRRTQPLFIRVADSGNNTLHVFAPSRWEDFNLNLLEQGCPSCAGWTTISCNNDTYVLDVLSSSLTVGGNRVQVGMSSQRRQVILAQFRKIFLMVMAPLFILGLTGGLFLSRRTLRPIRSIIDTVKSIDSGSLDARVPRTNTGDELDSLARLFNGMLESINRLIHGMENSLDNVAHDLRTPMTRLRNVSEMALQEEDPELLKHALEKGIEESDRILSLLTTLMDVSEAETGLLRINAESVNVSQLVDTIAEMYLFVAEEKGVLVTWTVEEDITAFVDPHRMSQALANILDNAVKFTPKGGEVSLEATTQNETVVITVQDNGEGIRPEDLPRIWDRLFRGDKSRTKKGLGLGLSLVRGIITAHAGTVEVTSTPGDGSRFEIQIPLGQTKPA